MEPRMPTNEVVEYESWNLSDVEPPPRSRLYHLAPAAFGTGLVESLTSYFSRLAEAHSVSAGVLNHRELLPRKAGGRNMFSCAITARTRCFTATLNSLGNAAARFASVVGKLTARTDLEYLTMLPWKPLLPTQLLTRGVSGWCPQCLNRWRNAGKTVYIPLLWGLEVVKYCPEHRSPLQLVCPYCERPQPLLGQCSAIGYCTRCKKWLGAEETIDRGSDYSLLRPETADWEVWAANQVRDMIRAGFDKPTLLTRQKLSQLLWVATDGEGLSAFARTLGVSPTCVTAWRSGRKLPMLPVYLRIARTFNVTLTELITGAVQPDSIRSLDTLGVPYWRNVRIGRKRDFDPVKAQRQLTEALQESPPPSLRAFQKRTGYHWRTLQKHFSPLCDVLRERFRQHQAEAIRKRRKEKITEFRKIAHQLHKQGIELFVHRVLKRMSVPLSLDYRLACSLLIDVKQELLKANRTHT